LERRPLNLVTDHEVCQAKLHEQALLNFHSSAIYRSGLPAWFDQAVKDASKDSMSAGVTDALKGQDAKNAFHGAVDVAVKNALAGYESRSISRIANSVAPAFGSSIQGLVGDDGVVPVKFLLTIENLKSLKCEL
jgi:hypothetical protein